MASIDQMFDSCESCKRPESAVINRTFAIIMLCWQGEQQNAEPTS
jgi:hypothetical protein